MAFLAAVLLLLALLAAVLLSRWFVQPLGVLGRGAERLAAGDFREPLAVRTGDELEELAERFNYLARRLDEQQQVREQIYQTERLRSLGQLAAGVAHDFNNVLALVALRAESLAEDLRRGRATPEQVERALDTIQRAALDGAETVRRIQMFGRQRESGPLEAVDLDQLCLDTAELTRGRWRNQAQEAGANVHLALELGGPPPAWGRLAELREVLTNLIINAVDAMPQGGTLTLRTWAHDDKVYLAVGDTGVGMPVEVQQRVFEPFYTTKGAGGTGLGLAVSYGIVQSYDGDIAVESAPGRGATFTVGLRAAHVPRPAPTPLPLTPAAPARVLVVEDEPGLRQLLATILQHDGHEVTVAPNGQAGLELLARERFALVLSDVAMPEVSGWDLARTIHEREPHTPVVFVSGWGDTFDADRLAAHGVLDVVPKPFRAADVRAAVASALAC
jgi:signal transduction histidine kinase/CheY-like chemotaxis protein